MKTLLMTVTTEEPLLVGDRHGDGSGALLSQTCIPGQTVRGALAGIWEHTADKAWFERAIANAEVGFSPLFPVTEKPKSGDVWGQIPFTAASCKRFGGFQAERDHHGVVDRLLQRELWFESGNKPKRPRLCDRELVGTSCGSPLEKFCGFFHMDHHGKAESVDLDSRLMTRTAVNDQIDSVAASQLYSLKPLNEEKRFSGLIQVPDDLDTTPLKEVEHLRLGKSRSRGLGKVGVEFDTWSSPLGGPLRNRVRDFLTWLASEGVAVPDDETWITLDLWTPLLLRDAWMRDRLQLETRDFAMYDANLHWDVETVALESVWTGGWHGLLNLPRTHRQALAPGGVLALKVRGARDKVLDALTKIETHGLGENWADGFGRVIVCHPFHQTFFSKENVPCA